jgi:hypothetical protein
VTTLGVLDAERFSARAPSRHVRFTPKATGARLPRYVRFVPKADEVRRSKKHRYSITSSASESKLSEILTRLVRRSALDRRFPFCG